jgi:hypothetical protein
MESVGLIRALEQLRADLKSEIGSLREVLVRVGDKSVEQHASSRQIAAVIEALVAEQRELRTMLEKLEKRLKSVT